MKKLKSNGKKKFLKNKWILLLIPVIFLNSFFIFGSLILGAYNSFFNNSFVNGWTKKGKFILFDNEILKSLKFSLKISSSVVILTVFFSLIIVYVFFDDRILIRKVNNMLYIPLSTSYLLIAFFMLFVLSTTGILNRIINLLLNNLGISYMPEYIHNKKGIGIISVYLWKTIPFMLLILFSSLDKIKKDFYKIGYSLGASRFEIFYELVLPLIIKKILYSSIIIGIFVLSAIEIPLVIGSSYPQMISLWIYNNYTYGDFIERSFSYSINTIILLMNLILLFLIYNFFEKKEKRL